MDFFDLGRSSLEEMAGITVRPRLDLPEWADEAAESLRLRLGDHGGDLIRLTPSGSSVPVVGIDTTNIELGQTSQGTLCAVRGTVVKAEKGRYEYVRHGPFIFHITNRNRQALNDNLTDSFLGMHQSGTAPPLEKMMERIRAMLERWLQRQAGFSYSGALILWDGSLAAPRTSRSLPLITRMLREARQRENTVLAFSKKTTLMLWNGDSDIVDSRLAPSLLDIDQDAHENYAGQVAFMGHVYAAKLRPGSYTMRLDVDRSISAARSVQAVQELLSSDGLYENYPETLRLAHVLSKFSPAEVIGMHRFVGKTYGFQAHDSPNVRRAILNPLEGDFHGGPSHH